MKSQMQPCHVVAITTPKKFLLNGLWFGPKKPRRAIILVHGLFSSAFSMRHLVDALVDAHTAVITFNNRGFELVTGAKRMVRRKKKWYAAGTAHEVFIDCVDDIQGAISAVRAQKVREVYLAGHSTGSQKIVYWAYKNKKGKGVKGLILLAPLSDYADVRKDKKYRSALRVSRLLVRMGKKHELLPHSAWKHAIDAQRFISLYTPDSIEEIFSYTQKDRNPRIYKSVRLPVLAFFAGNDEYADRSAEKLTKWFTRNSRSKRFTTHVVPKAKHSFHGAEKVAAREIRRFIRG